MVFRGALGSVVVFRVGRSPRRRSGRGAVCLPGAQAHGRRAGADVRTPPRGCQPPQRARQPAAKNNPQRRQPTSRSDAPTTSPSFFLSLSIAQCLQLLHLVLTTRRQHPHPHPHPHPHCRRRRRRHHHHQPCWQQCLLLLLLLLLCLTATAPTGLAARATCRPA